MNGYQTKLRSRRIYNISGISEWTLAELTGQVFIFFIAGFETSATGLVLAIHELAINPDAQEELYQEIKDFNENKGALTYDNIADLKYLDCVLNGDTIFLLGVFSCSVVE